MFLRIRKTKSSDSKSRKSKNKDKDLMELEEGDDWGIYNSANDNTMSISERDQFVTGPNGQILFVQNQHQIQNNNLVRGVNNAVVVQQNNFMGQPIDTNMKDVINNDVKNGFPVPNVENVDPAKYLNNNNVVTYNPNGGAQRPTINTNLLSVTEDGFDIENSGNVNELSPLNGGNRGINLPGATEKVVVNAPSNQVTGVPLSMSRANAIGDNGTNNRIQRGSAVNGPQSPTGLVNAMPTAPPFSQAPAPRQQQQQQVQQAAPKPVVAPVAPAAGDNNVGTAAKNTDKDKVKLKRNTATMKKNGNANAPNPNTNLTQTRQALTQNPNQVLTETRQGSGRAVVDPQLLKDAEEVLACSSSDDDNNNTDINYDRELGNDAVDTDDEIMMMTSKNRRAKEDGNDGVNRGRPKPNNKVHMPVNNYTYAANGKPQLLNNNNSSSPTAQPSTFHVDATVEEARFNNIRAQQLANQQYAKDKKLQAERDQKDKAEGKPRKKSVNTGKRRKSQERKAEDRERTRSVELNIGDLPAPPRPQGKKKDNITKL
jgi:hypothetical protein